MEEKKRGLVSTAAVMAVIILLSKIFGLLRDALVASAYGTTAPAVAYETATRLPVLLFDLVLGGVVSAAFIPVFNELLVKEGKRAAMRYAASYVNLIFVLSSTLTVLGLVFASPLITLLAPKLPPETHALAVELCRILFPMVICTGLAYSFVGILQSSGEFTIPALISLVSNTIMVVYLIFFGDRFGVTGLSLAMLLGWAAQMVVQIPSLRKCGFRPSLRAGLYNAHIRRSLALALPILIGTWTQPICSLVNTSFASALEDGRAITALGYANRLYTIIVGVFSFVATNLLFPYFARAAASGDTAESRRLMMRSVKVLFFLIAPIAVGVAILAEPCIALVFERQAFTSEDTLLTAQALRMFTVGMLFMAGNEVLTKAFFAENQPRWPMCTALLAMGVNIVLVILLVPYGIGGIALASALASAVQCIANAIIMHIRGGGRLPGSDLLDLGRSILAAAVMGGVLWFVLPHLPASPLMRCLIAVPAGGILYALITVLLRSEEADFILSKLRPAKGENRGGQA